MADRTGAFVARPGLDKLTDAGAYPLPRDMLEAAEEGRREKAILARLWMSEGIPFAFRDCPGLYEDFRDSLAKRLKLDAKQISVAGSGRLGYSLAPKKWGNRYQSVESDLDLFAVSEELFEGLREDFERWRDDYNHGEAQPRTEQERFYWSENQEGTPHNIRNGFIDSKRVPNWKRYGAFSNMNRCLADLWHKLQKTDGGPKPQKRLSLRCYRDWPSYEGQMVINLRLLAKYKPND